MSAAPVLDAGVFAQVPCEISTEEGWGRGRSASGEAARGADFELLVRKSTP